MEKYKIKILHIINPHLIWAEVVSDDYKTFKYLQLGIDGILPLSPYINSFAKQIKFVPGTKWVQATTVIMYECIQDAVSVWFKLNFIDHRDTIFDTTDHLYGDIIVKTRENGSVFKLSNILINSNVAYKDQELFYQYLGNGKLCTRLQDHETSEVVANIEKVIRNDRMINDKIGNDEIIKNRIDSLHSRLTVFFQVHNLIEEFGKRSDMKQYIGNIRETFKYIKDCDEVSYGNGCRGTNKRKHDNSKNDLSVSLEDKSTVRMKRIQNCIEQFYNLKSRGLADDYSDNMTEEEAPRVISKFFTRRNLKTTPEQIVTDTSRSCIDSDNNSTNISCLQSESQGTSAVSKFFTKRNIVTKIRDNNIDSDNDTNATLRPESPKPSPVSKFFTRRNITTVTALETIIRDNNIDSDNNTNATLRPESPKPSPVSKFFTRRNITTVTAPETKIRYNNIDSDNNTNATLRTESPKPSPVSKFFTRRNITTVIAPETKIRDNNIDFDNNINATLRPESPKSSPVSKFFTRRNITTVTAPETKIRDNNIDSDNNTNATLRPESPKPSPVSKFFTRRNITCVTATETKIRDNNIDSDNNTNATLRPESPKPSPVSKFFTRRNITTVTEPETKIRDNNIDSDNNTNATLRPESPKPSPESKFFTRRNITTVTAPETKIRHNNIDSDNNTNATLRPESPKPSPVSKLFTRRNITTVPEQKLTDTIDSNIKSDNNISRTENDSPGVVSKFFAKRNIKTTLERDITKTNIQTENRSDANVSKINTDNSKDYNESFTNGEKKQIADNRLIEVKISSPSKLNKATQTEKALANNANKSPLPELELDEMPTRQKYRSCNSSVSDSDNESTASCLLDRINRLNPQAEIADEKNFQLKVNNPHANFFNNMSPSISKFVDRLVKPVLMVHTKHNEQFEPLVYLRDFHFNQTIRSALSSMSVKGPMTVQSLSWYSILRGYSTFMISPLGSGKTLGYTPCVCQLVVDYEDDIELAAGQGPICIIMCATASSVIKVARQCRSFLKNQKTVLSCYPGVNEEEMTLLLLDGCDIFVCTPCALVRFLSKTVFNLYLKRLTVCVFDNFERLDNVYINEVTYLLKKIKETYSARINKVHKVQYVIASRTWCSIFEKLAKSFVNTVICIGAYQECVLYSKAHTTVSFVQRKNKLSKLIEFFNEIDSRKRAVVVCRTDEEVREVAVALNEQHHHVLSSDNTMTVEVLYRLSTDWFQYDDPIAPVLVCCDSNLTHLNVTNACYLFHYSMPNLYSTFCRRFSSLTDNFTSIFEENAQNNVRIGIILDENNAEQLPKIVNFIRRCKSEIPAILNKITESVSLEKDRVKAENLVPVCNKLLLFGQCAEYWNCTERHNLFKEFDSPQVWCPKSGIITFIILHYKNAVTYSVRLLSNVVNGVINKYPQNYATLCMKMGLYYSKEGNKRPHGIPKIGDVCAVGINAYKFERCEIVKILTMHRNGNPDHVLVKLIDEEKFERTNVVDLYHLPDHLKNIISYVVEVKLCGLQPKDRDVSFSELSEMHLRDLLSIEKTFYIRANIVAVIGNNIMVDNLNVCQELSYLKTIVVRYSFKEELMRKHALENKEHIPKLLEICHKNGFIVKDDIEVPSKAQPTLKHLPVPQWAHLDKDELSVVYFASIEHPGKFFVRHVKFDYCLKLLMNDIQKYISDGNVKSVSKVLVDQYVLAKFPADSLYYRARVDAIDDTKIKCFFVDHGDWRFVNIKDIYELTEGFIKQIPFQAIECRLVALKPPCDEWPEISTNWLCNICFIDDSEDSKQLYVKYFTKETAESTGGNKYGIVVIDTTSNQDMVFNQSMLDLNFAPPDEDEVQYLDDCMRTFNIKADNNISEEKQWELVAEPYLDRKFVRKLDENNQLEGSQGSLMNNLFVKAPQKSMTFQDDNYDSDQWEMQMDVSEVSKYLGLPSTPDSGPSTTPESFVKIGSAETSSDFEMLPKIVELPDTEPKLKELSPKSKVKDLLPECEELLKPKVNWYQKYSIVVIKIEVLDTFQYDIDIAQRSLSFKATVHDKMYGFKINLYGIVDPVKSTHAHKGLYVQVKLAKILNKKWLSLHDDNAKRKWIVYDPDALDLSSDEDDIDQSISKQTFKNIVEATYYNKSDSDSDDVYFLDDLEQEYEQDSD